MKITKKDIKKMLCIPDDIDLSSFQKLKLYNLEYDELDDAQHQIEVIRQLNRNKADNKKVGTIERKLVWENGWTENYEELQKHHSIDSLMPKYFRKNQPFRLFQKFIHTNNYKLDFELGRIIKSCLFEYYLRPYKVVYEFGCGTAFNLVELASIFPEKELFGYDYTEASGKIINILRDEMKYNIHGTEFDFFNPDEKLHLKKNSAVYTVAALEQVGKKWDKFLDYLLAECPSRVINLEPIEEFYDVENNVLDWLAFEFHRKRGYLSGYYTRLKELEAEGKIKIIAAHRSYFGNLNDESYSVVVWEPQ